MEVLQKENKKLKEAKSRIDELQSLHNGKEPEKVIVELQTKNEELEIQNQNVQVIPIKIIFQSTVLFYDQQLKELS